jgi:hypothetical protein
MPLVHHEEIHAVSGELYCSKYCAVQSIMDEIILNAKEAAIEEYDSKAEIVSIHDVLAEDLQTVEIVVMCMKRIQLPKNLTESDALTVARELYEAGQVAVEVDDCDEVIVKCELVKDDNSEHTEE